jgi:uncharacterized protein YecE (DUF72 family)
VDVIESGNLGTEQRIYVGTAAWSIPGEYAARFGAGDSHLARYGTRLPAVEINTSFYRLHRRETYARWADTVPPEFRFSVKVPKTITHHERLVHASSLSPFLDSVAGLGEKLGALLVQTPPHLPFEARRVRGFFEGLRARFEGGVVCEPRHPSWFAPEPDALLESFQIARVAADPAPSPDGVRPGGWPGLVYYRLHGSPEKYHSSYTDEFLDTLAGMLRAASRAAPAWCIFDNTAEGAGTANALDLVERL